MTEENLFSEESLDEMFELDIRISTSSEETALDFMSIPNASSWAFDCL